MILDSSIELARHDVASCFGIDELGDDAQLAAGDAHAAFIDEESDAQAAAHEFRRCVVRQRPGVAARRDEQFRHARQAIQDVLAQSGAESACPGIVIQALEAQDRDRLRFDGNVACRLGVFDEQL